MDSVRFEEEMQFMKCFRCDLGFWDVCYTTETICSLGERCFTGRGKAGVYFQCVCSNNILLKDVTVSTTDHVSPGDLDIKTLGCVKAEECGVENTVEFFSNKTIFVMTKHCCHTPFCNSAHKLQITTLFYLAMAVLTTWYLTEASIASC